MRKMKREYGKCEAYRFLEELRYKIHITEDKEEVKRVVKLLEKATKIETKKKN